MKDTASKKYEQLFCDNELDVAAAATHKEDNEHAPVNKVRIILDRYRAIERRISAPCRAIFYLVSFNFYITDYLLKSILSAALRRILYCNKIIVSLSDDLNDR